MLQTFIDPFVLFVIYTASNTIFMSVDHTQNNKCIYFRAKFILHKYR